MAISNYSELKLSIANWIARDDLTEDIDNFIDLAESRINYGSDDPYKSEPLSVLGMEQANEDITISAQMTSLPTGFLEARALYLDTSNKADLDYLPPDRFWQTTLARSGTAQPSIYTIQGTNLVVAPSPDTTYTGKISYFKKLDPLSSTTTTNWLITNAPNIYLYGALLEAYIFIKDYDEADKMFSHFRSSIGGLVNQDKRARHSGSSLVMRVDVNP